MIPEDVKINPAKKEKRRKVVTENMIRAGIFFQPNAVSQLLSVLTNKKFTSPENPDQHVPQISKISMGTYM